MPTETREEGIAKILANIQQDLLEQSILSKQSGKPNDFATGYTTAIATMSKRFVNVMPNIISRLIAEEDPTINLLGMLELQISLYTAAMQLINKEKPDPSIEVLNDCMDKLMIRLQQNKVIEEIARLVTGRMKEDS